MICKKCGVDKSRYNFFDYSGKYDRTFFVGGWQPGLCWECASPYRCIECHEIKPASSYRLMGRICADCKSRKLARRDTVPPYEQG